MLMVLNDPVKEPQRCHPLRIAPVETIKKKQKWEEERNTVTSAVILRSRNRVLVVLPQRETVNLNFGHCPDLNSKQHNQTFWLQCPCVHF